MKTTNIIKVSLIENDQFQLIDPDTKKTFTLSSGLLHTKRFFVDTAITDYFLSFFPGKKECELSPEAETRIRNIADWNADFEDDVVW